MLQSIDGRYYEMSFVSDDIPTNIQQSVSRLASKESTRQVELRLTGAKRREERTSGSKERREVERMKDRE
ncbi:hypothetical protein MJO28_013907 [Puccinia striiformis f. sp. tritici]|uniref:Uncharacterized protein n=1 Tax=Puccinia striiformis f. sp. tritici TaxID=168172 RepID=A0ACC0DWZ4_9BASI|nr:hypothetical protein MJO28_013907 [Puccinia striiformis f. sp. tritici]KAI7941677.1 hypothetical protein MJO29_013751 [Puccinia striiformis f. sp. tritici]